MLDAITLPTNWPLFVLAAFFAEILGTMAGFGSATVLTPMATLFFDIKTAIAMVAAYHIFGNFARVLLFRQVQWPLFWRFSIASLALTFLGAWCVAWWPSALIQLAFGLFLLAYTLAGALKATPALVPTARTAIVGGMSSGFLAGLLGTGGAVRATFLTAFALPRDAYLATSAMIALLIDSTRLPVYLSQRLVRREHLPLLGMLLVIAWLGAVTGRRLVEHLPARQFRRFVFAMLFVMGLKLIWDGVAGLR